ncbi:hypothetical protein AB0H29_28605 [Streptomyces thermolilacinus]
MAEGRAFVWSLRHSHRTRDDAGQVACGEVLSIRRCGARGRLRLVFRVGPGRIVPDGYPVPSGVVGTAPDRTLNLHEPGTVRAFPDVALRRGWDPDGPVPREPDGWSLLDEAHTLRTGACRAPARRAASAAGGP